MLWAITAITFVATFAILAAVVLRHDARRSRYCGPFVAIHESGGAGGPGSQLRSKTKRPRARHSRQTSANWYRAKTRRPRALSYS